MDVKNILIFFKTPRQATEFGNLVPHLKLIFLDFVYYIFEHSSKTQSVTITEVNRTQEEQDDIYLNHPDPEVRAAYKASPWLSTHQFKRAIDVRIFDIPEKLLTSAKDYINKRYPYDPTRPKKKTALVHNVGRGPHAHLQDMGVA